MGEIPSRDPHLGLFNGEAIDSMAEAVEQAKAEHRALEARIQELNTVRHLSQQEHAEMLRLKKIKLQKKDEITRLASRLSTLTPRWGS